MRIKARDPSRTTVRISRDTMVGSKFSHLASALPYSFPKNKTYFVTYLAVILMAVNGNDLSFPQGGDKKNSCHSLYILHNALVEGKRSPETNAFAT